MANSLHHQPFSEAISDQVLMFAHLVWGQFCFDLQLSGWEHLGFFDKDRITSRGEAR